MKTAAEQLTVIHEKISAVAAEIEKAAYTAERISDLERIYGEGSHITGIYQLSMHAAKLVIYHGLTLKWVEVSA